MKKTFLSLLIIALLCLPLAAPAEGAWLSDQAGLLSASDADALSARIEALYEEYRMAFGIVTTNDFGGKTPEAYADDYFDYEDMGYGSDRDGMVFVVNMESRDMYLSTHAKGISVLNDAAIARILAACGEHLRNGDVAAALNTYLDLAVGYTQSFLRVTDPPSVASYSTGTYSISKTSWIDGLLFTLSITLLPVLPVSLIVALVVLIIMLVMHNRSLPMPPGGSAYLNDKGVEYTHEADVFMHTNTTQTARPKNNDSGGHTSTHTSSSGETHGGGGAKF